MKKLSETTARTTIGMMRSMASHVPISPFHLAAADDMEKLLEEVMQYRKEKKCQPPTNKSSPSTSRPIGTPRKVTP
jgi:hypothetical protein